MMRNVLQLLTFIVLSSLSAFVHAVAFGPYDDTTAGVINGTTGCAGTELTRVINVPDNFTVDDLNVGFNASHVWRADIVVTLQSPTGTTVTIITDPNANEQNDNYDFLLDSASANPLNDGNNDNVAAPLYDRTVAPTNSLNAFNTQAANGNWTLRVCDRFAGADDGTFNSVSLIFDGTPSATAATIAKAFSPTSVSLGNNSTITFTLTNSNAAVDLSGVGFTDNMPAAIDLASTTLGGTCNGFSVTSGTVGASSFSVGNGSMAANTSCTVTVTVTGVAEGVHANTSTGVSSNETAMGAVSNTANLTVLGPATIAKSFNAASISSGATSILRFTLTNPNGIGLTGVNFTDNMPAAITLSNATVGGSCAGVTLDAGTIAGSSIIGVTSGVVPASSSCTIEFTVTSSTVAAHNNTSSGVNSNETGLGVASNTATLTVTPAATSIVKAFSPAAIQADETTSLSFTLTNPNGVPLTGVNFTDSMPSAMWLDSTTVGGTCTGFTLTGALGTSNLTLTNGTLAANSSCSIDLTVRSDVIGSHNNTTSGVGSNEAATGGASNTAQLTVSSSPSAVCTPGDLGGGSINFANGTQLYSLNLATGKVEPLTTVPGANVPSGVINSVAVDPRNYIIYYMDNTGANTNRSVFGYDILAGTHFTVEADVTTNHGLVLGSRGLGSGGASFFGSSLYIGIEDRAPTSDEVVFRLQMSADGRSVRYAQEILTLPATEFGDLVVTGSDLLIFDAGNDLYRRFDLATLSLQATAGPNAAYSQGGAQRDGSTMWAVSNVIQEITIATGGLVGASIALTTDGTTAAPSAADSGGCVPTTSRIGDLVWNDSNLDGIKDNTEIGIGNVTLDLYYDLNGDGLLTAADDITGDSLLTSADRIQTTITATDGSYHFNNLVPDDYLVNVTDANNILGGAAPTNGADPRAATNLSTNEERSGIDFGYSSFVVVQGGSVFNDNGIGGAIAHDGIQQASELGFEGVLVRVLDPGNSNALITSTLTDPNGSYSLYIPNAFANNPIDIVVDTVSGHLSVSENVSTTGATNVDARDDKITFTPVAGSVHNNVNFGDVPVNIFVPNNTGTVQAGQVVLYDHIYTSGTAGDVAFSTVEIQTPSGLNWQHLLYHDVDCSGDLSSAESSTALAASLTLTAGQKVCLINKVFAPSNAPFSAQYVTTLSADFTYTGETPDGLFSQLSVNDLTTLALAGLTLTKTVENIDGGGGAVTSNTALPGQQLQYTVTYRNNSSGEISTLVVRDTVPAYTALAGPVVCPLPTVLPNNLTACSVVLPAGAANAAAYNGPIEWSFTGTLGAGQEGSLSFDVLVE